MTNQFLSVPQASLTPQLYLTLCELRYCTPLSPSVKFQTFTSINISGWIWVLNNCSVGDIEDLSFLPLSPLCYICVFQNGLYSMLPYLCMWRFVFLTIISPVLYLCVPERPVLDVALPVYVEICLSYHYLPCVISVCSRTACIRCCPTCVCEDLSFLPLSPLCYICVFQNGLYSMLPYLCM